MRCSNLDFLFVVVLFGYYIRNSRTATDEDFCHKRCSVCNDTSCKINDACTCCCCRYDAFDHSVCNSLCMDCESKKLEDIPDLEFNTKHLNLQNNIITKLHGHAFSNVTLESLDLRKNKFNNNINENAFRGLDQLQYLSLSENTLKQINITWFADLKSLTFLVLQNCKLTNINEDLFKNSPNLEWINLGDNNIKSIPSTLFSKQTRIRRLELFNNLIEYIPDAFFETSKSSIRELFLHDNLIETIHSSLGLQYLTNLANLTLFRNPFKCNCDLTWFINWTQKNKRRFLELNNTNIKPLCDNINNNLWDLNVRDLHCNWIWWEVAVGVSVALLLVIFYLKFPYIRRRISNLIHKQHYIKLQSTAAGAGAERKVMES